METGSHKAAAFQTCRTATAKAKERERDIDPHALFRRENTEVNLFQKQHSNIRNVQDTQQSITCKNAFSFMRKWLASSPKKGRCTTNGERNLLSWEIASCQAIQIT
jgi:hypothetical protein